MTSAVTTHRAPRTLNKSATAYPALKELFSSRGALSLHWRNKSTHVIGAHTFSGKDMARHRFTLDELNEVCPLMAEFLESMKLGEFHTLGYNIGKAARILWKHCSESTILIERRPEKEVYIDAGISINAWAIQENFVDIVGCGYTITFGEKQDLPCITNIVVNDNGLLSLQRIALDQFEELYPGFGARLQAAEGLGLSEKEMLDYVFSTDEKNDVAFNSLPALPCNKQYLL